MTIVSDEPYHAYSRPLISEYLAGKCSVEKMAFRPADFYATNSIRAVLGDRAVSLDTDKHAAELESGTTIAWRKLLLATGGVPVVPPTRGLDLPGVFTFTRLDDAMAIDRFLGGHRGRTVKVVVIGGGLIGVSATEALVERGVEVTVVEMKDRILNVILDEAASALASDSLGRAGVRMVTGHTVAGVTAGPEGRVSGVTLDDGQQMSCDLVILAIGVRPRTELAAGAGVKVSRGISVDRRMATSATGVFACGDVAEAYDFVYGENRLTPIWPNAYVGGRVAGFNMAGVSTDYAGGTAMNSLKYFGLAVASAGIVNPPDSSYEVISRGYDHTYRSVVLKNGVTVGMVLAGDTARSGIVYGLMKDRVRVEAFKQALVAEDFGLACLPEVVWRARLEQVDQVVERQR
ncbi:MAG: FAD-dependent oxidoreductase [Chloroflexota bacterium]